MRSRPRGGGEQSRTVTRAGRDRGSGSTGSGHHPPPVTNGHTTPLAGAKDIRKAFRPRIERELCAVGGALRRKVEAEYQSELAEKYRDLKRRHQEQRQQLDRALRELDDADPPRKRARV